MLEKILKFFPIGSAIAYKEKQNKLPEEQQDSSTKRKLKTIGHISYATLGTVVFGAWLFFANTTGKLNPLDQYHFLDQRFKQNKAQEKYVEELHNQLFGEGGLVDTNENNRNDSWEMLDFYERAGVPEVDISVTNIGEKLRPMQYEKAIVSYEEENQ